MKLGNEVRERINGKTDGTTGSPSDDNLLKDDKMVKMLMRYSLSLTMVLMSPKKMLGLRTCLMLGWIIKPMIMMLFLLFQQSLWVTSSGD